jgi:hypothetical protein
VMLPNRLASVTLQRSESSAASELESPAFSLREVKALRQDLFPSRPFVYWGRPASLRRRRLRTGRGLSFGSGPCFPGRHIQSKSDAVVA